MAKTRDEFRNYTTPARDTVVDFYRLNHRYQTVDFVRRQHERFVRAPQQHRTMTVMEAIDFLDTLVDDSDPDTSLSQRQHLLQTAQSIRAAGHEDWFVLAGLLHDLGKLLCLFGEPQWAVVGDTFPVGCRFDERIVYHEFFDANPDAGDDRYNTKLGIYSEGCGLRNVLMSWGHDEYLYQVLKDYLPEPALYMIRYHSFYAWHSEGAYEYLLDDHDRKMLAWVRRFNPHDLYSKTPEPPDWPALKPYYETLIERLLPSTIRWPAG